MPSAVATSTIDGAHHHDSGDAKSAAYPSYHSVSPDPSAVSSDDSTLAARQRTFSTSGSDLLYPNISFSQFLISAVYLGHSAVYLGHFWESSHLEIREGRLLQ
jgi:hypothetical protein